MVCASTPAAQQGEQAEAAEQGCGIRLGHGGDGDETRSGAAIGPGTCGIVLDSPGVKDTVLSPSLLLIATPLPAVLEDPGKVLLVAIDIVLLNSVQV
jgi:hypothetical protein